MAEYLSPGVYVEEKPSGNKPIAGVGTSTAAFVGIAEKGPIDSPVFISNFTQFVKNFGNYVPGYLYLAVRQFFAEGGSRCYVVRTCEHEADGTAKAKTARVKLGELELRAASPGPWPHNRIAVYPATGQSPDKFDLLVLELGARKKGDANQYVLKSVL